MAKKFTGTPVPGIPPVSPAPADLAAAAVQAGAENHAVTPAVPDTVVPDTQDTVGTLDGTWPALLDLVFTLAVILLVVVMVKTGFTEAAAVGLVVASGYAAAAILRRIGR